MKTPTVGSRIIEPPEFSPFEPIVNKSFIIECCGKKIPLIVANMMLSVYLQLIIVVKIMCFLKCNFGSTLDYYIRSIRT